MITLITATPGGGKTLFAVREILKLIKNYPDRQIYSNIDGLKIDTVLPAPDDWRETPDGSIVFYDEAQKIERYGDNKKYVDSITKDLDYHRHSGHDLYFITQAPDLLNKYVLNMVGVHYHLARILNTGYSKIYSWSHAEMQINAPSVRKRADANEVWKHPKTLFSLYNSASMHTMKARIPKKLYYSIGFILLLCLIFWLIFNSTKKNNNKIVGSILGSKNEKIIPTSIISSSTISNSSSTISNVNTNSNVNSNSDKSIIYDATKPFDVDYSNQTYKVEQLPKFSGAILIDKNCTAYTQQGTILKVTKKDCIKIANGLTPFNPFKKEVQQTTTNSNINNNSISNSQPKIINLPNKNIIEPSSK